MAYDDLLRRLGLDEDELVSRLLAVWGFNDLQIRQSDPQPLDNWEPTTTDSGAALTPAFARSLNGWEITLTAATPHARLCHSLERLPYASRVTSARLSYLTDSTWPNTNTVDVVVYDRITGSVSTQNSVALPRSSSALAPMILMIPISERIVNAGQKSETQVQINVSNTVNGSFLRVTGIAFTYSFYRSAKSGGA